jgi:ABC-2 type transport system permease protein
MNLYKKYALGIAVFGFLWWLAAKVTTQFDLTSDKRFTTSASTKALLQSIDSSITIKVYLAGNELPSKYKRLQRAVENTLNDFEGMANNKIFVKYIDPNSAYFSDEERQNLHAELEKKGVYSTVSYEVQNGKKIQTLVWPYAMVSKGSKTSNVLLLSNSKQNNEEETINESIENIEFELAQAIKGLSQKKEFRVGVFPEYSSVPLVNQIALLSSLKANYHAMAIDLKNSGQLENIDAIVVANPTKYFEPAEQLKIDQFIVKGGKAIFLLNAVATDTLGKDGLFAQAKESGLEQMLFKYGVRINTNLLKDLQMSGGIPMVVGTKENVQLIPWPYYCLAAPNQSHIIGKNLDVVFQKYVSTIDTVRAEGITKTALLSSSPYTQTLQAPASISYNMASKDFDQNKQGQGVRASAYLLEGKFESAFSNQFVQQTGSGAPIVSKQAQGKIIVISDGDVTLNEFNPKINRPYQMGYDKFSGNTFSNKQFFLNAMEYLLNPDGLLTARAKSVVLHPIDKVEVTQNASFWQILSLAIPLACLGLIGLGFYFYSKLKSKQYLKS